MVVNAAEVAIGVFGVVIAMVGWIAAVMYAGRPAPRKPAAVTLTVVPTPGRRFDDRPTVIPTPLARVYGDDARPGQRAA